MKRVDQPFSHSMNANDCTQSTESNICIELDNEITTFITGCDLVVDDLSWNIGEVILAQSRYRHTRFNDPAKYKDNLADELVANKAVKNLDDADSIADLAITYLYPAIDERLRELEYHASAIRSVNITKKPGRRIRCTVLLTAL